ncbi:MAG: hypothetical protein HY741_22805 [Chloroflexi bacterium]|nr:hypothetical protein [Chloroflexota bacterium]
MPNSIIEITCTRCGHTWTENVEDLKAGKGDAERVFYRGDVKLYRFRVKCPKDGTWNIVDVQEVDDE